MRLRNDPQAFAKIASASNVVNSFPLEVDSNFIVELGCGKGEMLVKLASKHPKHQYIGIERSATVLAMAARAAKDLTNLRFILADVNLLPGLISGKVSIIWITFPDPWPKKRHADRRIVHRKTLDLLRAFLVPGGKLIIKTDNDALFAFAKEELLASKWKIVKLTSDLHSHPEITNEMTGYEIKWSGKGKTINYLEALPI